MQFTRYSGSFYSQLYDYLHVCNKRSCRHGLCSNTATIIVYDGLEGNIASQRLQTWLIQQYCSEKCAQTFITRIVYGVMKGNNQQTYTDYNKIAMSIATPQPKAT